MHYVVNGIALLLVQKCILHFICVFFFSKYVYHELCCICSVGDVHTNEKHFNVLEI